MIAALMRNGYPKAFLDEHFVDTVRQNPDANAMVERSVVLKTTFRGDAVAELLRRKVQKTLKDNCHELRFRAIFTSRALISTQSKDPIEVMSKSNVVYEFQCACQELYVGRTSRRLEERVAEHIPRWMLINTSGNAKSAITEHILSSGHDHQQRQNFRIIYQARSEAILRYAEAIAILKRKPSLNIQVEFDYKLHFQWT